MGQLSPILRNVQGGGLMFWCPGCDGPHQVMTGPGSGPRWMWNGDVTRPTFTPSILVRLDSLSQAAADRNVAHFNAHGRYLSHDELPYDVHLVCHSFVTGGQIQFLGDCTHALAGQTMAIPAWKTAESG